MSPAFSQLNLSNASLVRRRLLATAFALPFPPRPGRRAPTHARRLPFAHGHDGSSRACRSRSARRRLSHDRAARALCSGVCRHDGPRARRKTHGCPARTQGAPARCERVRPRRRRFARVVGRTFDAREHVPSRRSACRAPQRQTRRHAPYVGQFRSGCRPCRSRTTRSRRPVRRGTLHRLGFSGAHSYGRGTSVGPPTS